MISSREIDTIEECSFQCLTNCPLPPDEYCFYDDPLIGMFNLVEYPEFFFWRACHNIDEEPPASLSPTDYRCPRCYSTNISISYPYIKCLSCNYNEPLIDFPISQYYHLALSEGRQ